ncbi:MAG: substrate-binding domain-containing protein, partial [Chloroflexi bacterium]|nr:substrate-binding domain-containing protein [Chloroflexota bacterium]
MNVNLKKYLTAFVSLIVLASMLAACGAPAATEAPAAEAPAATEAPAAEAPAQEEGKGPFTIGISNPFISSEYRTQMIAELIEVNKEYMEKGITTELVIESADTDVAGQIQQLQNLMAKGVDAILVNPGDVN